MSCMGLISSNFYFHCIYSKAVIRKLIFVPFIELSLTFLNKKVHFNSIWVLRSLLLKLQRQSQDFQQIWQDAGDMAAPWAGVQGFQGLPGLQDPADRAWCPSLGRAGHVGISHSLWHQAPPWGCRLSGTSADGWGPSCRSETQGHALLWLWHCRTWNSVGGRESRLCWPWDTPWQSLSH